MSPLANSAWGEQAREFIAIAAAIAAAEAEARRQHDAGTCHLSEWSCSHCEGEA